MAYVFPVVENAGSATAFPDGLTTAEVKTLLEETAPAIAGVVVQETSKATGVTLSTTTGKITMHAAALNADVIVAFTLTNTLITATDIILIEHVSGGTGGCYIVTAFPGAGSASIKVTNVSAGNLSEAIVLRFKIIRSADA